MTARGRVYGEIHISIFDRIPTGRSTVSHWQESPPIRGDGRAGGARGAGAEVMHTYRYVKLFSTLLAITIDKRRVMRVPSSIPVEWFTGPNSAAGGKARNPAQSELDSTVARNGYLHGTVQSESAMVNPPLR